MPSVYNFISNLTSNPFLGKGGKQKLKPLSHRERGIEAGFQEEVAHYVHLLKFNSLASNKKQNVRCFLQQGYLLQLHGKISFCIALLIST